MAEQARRPANPPTKGLAGARSPPRRAVTLPGPPGARGRRPRWAEEVLGPCAGPGPGVGLHDRLPSASCRMGPGRRNGPRQWPPRGPRPPIWRSRSPMEWYPWIHPLAAVRGAGLERGASREGRKRWPWSTTRRVSPERVERGPRPFLLLAPGVWSSANGATWRTARPSRPGRGIALFRELGASPTTYAECLIGPGVGPGPRAAARRRTPPRR